MLCKLRWLPIQDRVKFKVACLVRQSLSGQVPLYWAATAVSCPTALGFCWWQTMLLDKTCKLVKKCRSTVAGIYSSQPVLWHCWLGIRKSIRLVKNEWWGVGVVVCLEQGAYGPADVKTHNPIVSFHLNPDWFYLYGTGLCRVSWKRGRFKQVQW